MRRSKKISSTRGAFYRRVDSSVEQLTNGEVPYVGADAVRILPRGEPQVWQKSS
jgi:hypothetical protein